MDIQKLKEDVRRSGGIFIPPLTIPPKKNDLPESVKQEIRQKIHIDKQETMEDVLIAMEKVYQDVRTWGPDLSEDDRRTILRFGELLREASDLWWDSPALQRLAPGGEAGSPIHVLEQGIDAVNWVAKAYRPKLERKRSVIRKVLFHWMALGLPLPKSAVTDKISGTCAQPYILCGIMLKAIFEECPDDFSAMYEAISATTILQSGD